MSRPASPRFVEAPVPAPVKTFPIVVEDAVLNGRSCAVTCSRTDVAPTCDVVPHDAGKPCHLELGAQDLDQRTPRSWARIGRRTRTTWGAPSWTTCCCRARAGSRNSSANWSRSSASRRSEWTRRRGRDAQGRARRRRRRRRAGSCRVAVARRRSRRRDVVREAPAGRRRGSSRSPPPPRRRWASRSRPAPARAEAVPGAGAGPAPAEEAPPVALAAAPAAAAVAESPAAARENTRRGGGTARRRAEPGGTRREPLDEEPTPEEPAAADANLSAPETYLAVFRRVDTGGELCRGGHQGAAHGRRIRGAPGLRGGDPGQGQRRLEGPPALALAALDSDGDKCLVEEFRRAALGDVEEADAPVVVVEPAAAGRQPRTRGGSGRALRPTCAGRARSLRRGLSQGPPVADTSCRDWAEPRDEPCGGPPAAEPTAEPAGRLGAGDRPEPEPAAEPPPRSRPRRATAAPAYGSSSRPRSFPISPRRTTAASAEETAEPTGGACWRAAD